MTPYTTHEVSNQAPPLEDYNLFLRNRPLQDAVRRHGAAHATAWLTERGAELGSTAMISLGVQANRNPPTPKLFDRAGRRCDEVEFHPAYHELMAYLKRHGVSAGPWADPVAGAHVQRAALFADVCRDRGRHALPDDDDLCGRAVAGARRGDRAGMAPAHLLARLRSQIHPVGSEARRDAGDGNDGEAGRIGSALEHDRRNAPRRPRIPYHRAQVVPLGADVRCVPDPRAGPRRAVLLLPAALHAGGRRQRDPHRAIEGQARRPLQRELRGRVLRRPRLARR